MTDISSGADTTGYYWILLDTIGYYWILSDTTGYYFFLVTVTVTVQTDRQTVTAT